MQKVFGIFPNAFCILCFASNYFNFQNIFLVNKVIKIKREVVILPFFVKVLIRIVAAGLLGGLIGIERGKHGRAAGLRTHILVSVGAAMTSLTSLYLSEVLGYTGDVARISAQVISGIGFLGAGTIMVRNSSIITGLTTAAGMWATAAIGVATGYGFYIGAAAATLICIFSVTVLSHIEAAQKNNALVYIEFTDIA